MGRHKLGAPKGRGTQRPRIAIAKPCFSMLAARLDFDGLNVLDGFAGSGALGLGSIARRGELPVC